MKTHIIRLVALLALSVPAVQAAQAGETEPVQPLALQKIMRELGTHMQGVVDSIAREDWPMVEKIAPLIADHPQPPLAEKMRIVAFFGAEMAKFKGYDEQTHASAQALGQAARRGDGAAVIQAFGTLQSHCYACHQTYRKRFAEHFYGAAR